MAGEVTVKLSEPITAYGDLVDEITLRRPKGRDIRECGYPFKVYDDEGVEPLAVCIGRYISKLGDIPMGSVDQLEPSDFNAAMMEVLGFFGESPRTSKRSRATSRRSSGGSLGNSSTATRKKSSTKRSKPPA